VLKISIVTVTYNSERFLEATIQSILSQNYPNLEYIIIDGGSTDGTLNIIHKYESQLAYWISERDNGMYDALNKGFARATGDVFAWLNSDDMYMPWTLQYVNEVFQSASDILWLTSLLPVIWNAKGLPIDTLPILGYSKEGFFKGEHLPFGSSYKLEAIQQESTFWRRSLWEKAGERLEDSLRLAGDFELWARFYQHALLVGVRVPLGGFRRHGNQLSVKQEEQYAKEASLALEKHEGKPHSAWSAFLRRYFAPLFRFRFRRLGQRLGIVYPMLVYQSGKKDPDKRSIITRYI